MRCRRLIQFIGTSFGFCLLAVVAVSANAEKRALLIGITDYSPPKGATIAVPAGSRKPDSRFASGKTWPSLEGPTQDVASMKLLLTDKFAFPEANITVLTEKDETHDGILAAIDQLVAATKRGDLVVFYYSGHGSRRTDSLSVSKGGMDNTIVPVDAWKGDLDIRDKEMEVRFNQIVYDRRAHLTAIYDSCNSGTMARGITASVQRTLDYDDRDVALEKKKDPKVVVESDIKRHPQDDDAIILAAALPNEFAQEATYPDDHLSHGAFTRALVQVLRSSTQPMSAEEVVAEVSVMLHADSPTPVPYQQPSLEGATQKTLFGDPVAPHPLRVRIVDNPVPNPAKTVTLDVGNAGGFDAGTEFTSLEDGANGKKIVLQVASVDEPLRSTAVVKTDKNADSAQVSAMLAQIKVGDTFQLSKRVYPKAARLVVFAPPAAPLPDSAAIANTKAMFPGLKWIDDPTLGALDYLVVPSAKGWVAYGKNGAAVKSGGSAKGTAFLLLPPPQWLFDNIQKDPNFTSGAFTFTQKLTDASYLLATRIGASGIAEFSLVSKEVTAPHSADAYVRSVEKEQFPVDSTFSTNPEVVCRTDDSRPVRTTWIHADVDQTNEPEVAMALIRRMARIGKLGLWLRTSTMAPGLDGGWPYHLAVSQHGSDDPLPKGPLPPHTKYDVKMVADADQISKQPPMPAYIYVFGFDCAANPSLLYPPIRQNGVGMLPQPGSDGNYPTEFTFPFDEGVGQPFGADTILVMLTKEKITNLSLLTNDGVIAASRGIGESPLDDLMTDVNNGGSRGLDTVPQNWQMQQLVVPSKP
jgi:hypothetical protein